MLNRNYSSALFGIGACRNMLTDVAEHFFSELNISNDCTIVVEMALDQCYQSELVLIMSFIKDSF